MMRGDLLILALIVGACTWAFRVLPLRADLTRLPEGGLIARLLAATGPAALATLSVATLLPYVVPETGALAPAGLLALATGTGGVVLVFGATRSVVIATLAGALSYGAVTVLAGAAA